MSIVVEAEGAPGGCTTVPALPADLRDGLLRHFTPNRASYVARVLSTEELRVTHFADALTIARIKRMSPQRLMRFDSFVPINGAEQRIFHTAQMEWIRGEHYLLATRLGRSPTQAELSADFNAHRNGQRFRAYYVMKYPRRMKPIARCGIDVRTSEATRCA